MSRFCSKKKFMNETKPSELRNKWQFLLLQLFVGMCLVYFSACSESLPEIENRKSLCSYVNPFVGTDGPGNTYPGAQVPFGMVQLSPDNGKNGWDWIAGYYYPDSTIAGFSHTHLSGTGAGDLYDISFLPVSGKLKEARLDSIATQPTVYSLFSHEEETASPGFYQVYLRDYGITVSLTATTRTGLQRYEYDHKEAKVRLHLGYTRNWDRTTDAMLEVINDSTVIGYRKSSGWARDQRVFFVSIFSTPIEASSISDGKIYIDGQLGSGLDLLGEFDFGNVSEVMVKTGLSSVSIANALENLRTEQTGFDFSKVQREAENEWENEFSKVKIKASPTTMVNFYTAMYRSLLAPTIFSDVNGQYKGADGQVHRVVNRNRYTTFSLWDTFRALHPWLTLTQYARVSEMVHSMLDFYKEYGQLPVWNMLGNETDMMLGYHSVSVIAEAMVKGISGFDYEEAFTAMKKSAMQDKFGIKEYQEKGYVPHENNSWNVSLTMEYAYDDWCIAQAAEILNKTDDYQYFLNRSKSYQNHFDPNTGFMRAKGGQGTFKIPFDPLAYHPEDYAEANAWQYNWFVPHDVSDLIALHGGPVPFARKLDSLFTIEQRPGQLPAWISGYIGQYVHGNEPAHHVPYLYQYINQPGKTERLVREIMDKMYTNLPDGLCGNEDCGQMSAWYLFSALGFYPVNPAEGKYVFGSPVVDEAKMALPNGKQFIIKALNNSNSNINVKSTSLNGEKINRYYITHDEIMQGGELVFEME